MSTGDKRPLAKAREDARAFAALFKDQPHHRWEVAGSVRRGKAEVGDIEHVVWPVDPVAFRAAMDDMLGNPMFGTPAIIEKAVYPNGTNRWGDKYRGVMFRGFRHEVFLADRQNWGAILTIRTGPAEFSERLVTQLKASGRLRQQDGYVKYTATGDVYATPTEEAFFAACGEPWTEPGDRQ